MVAKALLVRLEEIEDEWERILPICSTDTIFVTPWWLRIWWRVFGSGLESHILWIRDGDYTLGIAPLRKNGNVVSFMGNDDVCDYADFLVPKGNEDSFYPAMFDYLPLINCNILELRSVPEDSPTLAYVPKEAEARGYSVELKEEDKSPYLPLHATWEGYLESLSRKNRHELKRKIRRLGRAGEYSQSGCEGPHGLHDCMADFFRLHRVSRPDKAEFMTLKRQRFFEDIATELTAKNQFRLSFLELNGIRVASCIAFDYQGQYLLYNSGYDPQFSELSVGLLNKALAVKEAIGLGKSTFDFLRGDERYKYDLGARDRSTYRLTIHC